MMAVKFNSNFAEDFVSKADIQALEPQAAAAQKTLMDGTGAGNDFLGWLHLPSSITDTELADSENTANVLRSKCEGVVAIGIGGSYLGTKAEVEALNNSFDW